MSKIDLYLMNMLRQEILYKGNKKKRDKENYNKEI